MISPEGFRELRKSVPLSRRACAEYLGCSVSTVRAWDRGRNRVPWSAVRLLRLLRLGDLGALHDDWTGWVVRGRMLVTPEGHALHVSDMAWWSLTCRQAEGFRHALDGWHNLSEVLRSMIQLPAEPAAGVAGVSPAGGAPEPSTRSSGVQPCAGVDRGPSAVSADASVSTRGPAPVTATPGAAGWAVTGLVSIGNKGEKEAPAPALRPASPSRFARTSRPAAFALESTP